MANVLEHTINTLRELHATAEQELKVATKTHEEAGIVLEVAQRNYHQISRALDAATGEDQMVKAMPSPNIEDYDRPMRGKSYNG